ncbi:GntR family transcriptional regulator, partial [Candidatus Kaiserbacteria bacterium]
AIVQPQMGSHIKYAFLSGMPDLRLFPHDEIRSHFSDALKRSRTKLLGYSDPAGHLPLVKQIEEYLRRVRAVKDRGIVVTNGSQEAIFIAAQLLLKSGDHVAVEASGYTPAWQALRASGASLVGVPVDSQGLDVEALEKLIKKKKIRLIYTTPLHQYPTTVTLSLARRMQLLDVATRHGIPVLEDDYDHEFHYKSQPLAPLASQDPAGVVIYISTFSKVMYPSARVGFMAVPERYHRQFSDFKRIISRQNDVVTQDAVARWMSDGGFERHMRKMRRNYEVRLRALVESLQKLDLKIIEPSGGMALWLDTEQNSGEIAIKAASAGVHVMPEEYFLLKKKKVATHLRLGFANQTPQEIGRGIAILGENILRG